MKKCEVLLTEKEVYELLNILVVYKTDRTVDPNNSDMKHKQYSLEEIATATRLQDLIISHM